jgi:two-component system phosphate regulon sensor histidine kinase PhoR
VMEVVREYSLLRETISDATEAGGIPLSGSCSRTVHRAINSAIGIAVQAFTLEKANELRARREENVAFIVHDLKTPLNAINLAARMIEESLVTDPSLASEMLQLILRNSARMETMLQKILKTEKALKSGVEAHLERREFDLWPLVQSVIDEMQTLATDAETKILNLIPRNSSVYADAVSLVTIFQNLLSNALKYTVCGKVSIRSKILDGAIEVCVEDTGEGIPETRMERLFLDREADPNKKGSTGLGLSIVQKAIEAHGGKLTVDSKVGKGTTFRFTLPNA